MVKLEHHPGYAKVLINEIIQQHGSHFEAIVKGENILVYPNPTKYDVTKTVLL